MYLPGTDSVTTDLYPHGLAYEHSARGDIHACVAHYGRKLVRHNSRSRFGHSGAKGQCDRHSGVYSYVCRNGDRSGRLEDVFRDDNRDYCASATSCADLHAHSISFER